MDRVSDYRLRWLEEWLDTKIRKAESLSSKRIALDLDLVLAELRERRAAEKADATKHDQECPYCGEYHDNRVACNPYQSRRPSP